MHLCNRDEIKKINRDKSQLTERLKDAEGAQLRLEGEVQSLRSAAASSAERHDSSNAQMKKQLQQAHDAVQAKQDEVISSTLLALASTIASFTLFISCCSSCPLLAYNGVVLNVPQVLLFQCYAACTAALHSFSKCACSIYHVMLRGFASLCLRPYASALTCTAQKKVVLHCTDTTSNVMERYSSWHIMLKKAGLLHF